MKEPSPPKWVRDFLNWYCRSDLVEDLEGDLHEYYLRNYSRSKRRADWIYVLDVLKFIRPYTIKKPKAMDLFRSVNLGKNFIKSSLRNLARNKLFSTINILGLSVSMAIGLIMIALLFELTKYDSFHTNSNKIYRLTSTYETPADGRIELATTSVVAGRKLDESFPGIDELVILTRFFNGDAKKGSNIIPIRGLYASESFFELFSFHLKQGNPTTALTEPYSLVLTETLAGKLFDSDPLGQSIEIGDSIVYKVSGVVSDPPFNSHIRFDALASIRTLDVQESRKESSRHLSWTNIWNNYVYFMLKDESEKEPLQQFLSQISEEENQKLTEIEINQGLQPFMDIVPGKNLSNQLGPTIDSNILVFLFFLTMIVLLSACFNYTNLSIAKSLKRAKEVGIRKVLGASRLQVFIQFVMEAIITSLIALLLAVLVFFWLRPHFLMLGDGELSNVLRLPTPPVMFIYFLGFAILTGIIAGLVPSMAMSRIRALLVLKDASRINLLKGIQLRKALIVVQFSISLVFVIACIGIYRQYKHALNFDLGFTTENIVNVELEGNDSGVILNSFSQMPGVQRISRSSMVVSTGDNYILYGKYKNPVDSIRISYSSIDENYIPIHELEMIAGSNFKPKVQAVNRAVIVNEELLERLNLGSPEVALQQTLILNGTEHQITGVMRDFHHNTITSPIRPFAFLYKPEQWRYVNVEVDKGSALNLNHLEQSWNEIDPVHPFMGVLYDDKIREAYGEYAAFAKIVGALAFIAIVIAVLGLLGMAVYTTESRLKEIGVRKILGASELGLMVQLSKGYAFMLLFSAVVSVPLAVYWLNTLFSDMIYKANSNIPEVLTGLAIILGLGMLIIGGRTLLAARTNPAEILKHE